MNEITEVAKPLSELSLPAQIALTAGGVILWLVFAVFFFRLFWRLIRAQLRTPDELAGIRAALERIADKLDQNR